MFKSARNTQCCYKRLSSLINGKSGFSLTSPELSSHRTAVGRGVILSVLNQKCTAWERARSFCFSKVLAEPDAASDGKGIFSYRSVDYKVDVKTGDQLHAGTDANVYIVFHSETGEKSEPYQLDYMFRDDFERGQLDTFQVKNIAHLKDIHKIEFWRDDAGLGSDWFVDYIEIEAIYSRKRFMFPVFRWIKPHRHYVIRHMDNCLPQFDPEPGYRNDELEVKKEMYQLSMKVPGGPSQVSRRVFVDSPRS